MEGQWGLSLMLCLNYCPLIVPASAHLSQQSKNFCSILNHYIQGIWETFFKIEFKPDSFLYHISIAQHMIQIILNPIF